MTQVFKNELSFEKYFIESITKFLYSRGLIFYLMKNTTSNNGNLGVFDITLILAPSVCCNFEIKMLKPKRIQGYLKNYETYKDKNYRVFKQSSNILNFKNSFYVTYSEGVYSFIREDFIKSSTDLIEAFIDTMFSFVPKDEILNGYIK